VPVLLFLFSHLIKKLAKEMMIQRAAGVEISHKNTQTAETNDKVH
jgi:hypothetical protein